MFEKLIIIISIIFLFQPSVFNKDKCKNNFFECVVGQSEEFFTLKKDDELYLPYNAFNFDSINNIEENKIEYFPKKIKNVSDININAKSAVVLDARTNDILYSKNQDEKLPIASLTKITTAMIVLEKSHLESIAVISENAAGFEKRNKGLVNGEKIDVKSLMEMMLINSDNAAAVALSEHTSGSVDKFVELMNEKAKSIGLKNTSFFNSSGLDNDENEEKENYSTAYETAKLIKSSLKEQFIWDTLKIKDKTVFSSDGKIIHKLKNTNILLGKLKNIIGGKTGFTDKAGECLAVVIEEPVSKNKIISVVLGANDRFSETEKLIKWTLDNYKWVKK